jgi:hypothetical protein
MNDATPAAAVMVHYPEDLGAFIPREDWAIYSAVLREVRNTGVRVAMSGGFTGSFYTGVWRNTKDMDLCVLPSTRERVIEATRKAGLHDLFDEMPYDRRWIYRATRDGVIVDTIWQHANFRGQVDDGWLELGPSVTLYGESVKLVPPEEMIWSKIYIVQRERCDWPDVINLLYATGAALDWRRLIERMSGDERVLGSVLLLFSWLAPGRAKSFPEWIWERLRIPAPEQGPERDDAHITLLESRPWFADQA